jgi:hypothetical protein
LRTEATFNELTAQSAITLCGDQNADYQATVDEQAAAAVEFQATVDQQAAAIDIQSETIVTLTENAEATQAATEAAAVAAAEALAAANADAGQCAQTLSSTISASSAASEACATTVAAGAAELQVCTTQSVDQEAAYEATLTESATTAEGCELQRNSDAATFASTLATSAAESDSLAADLVALTESSAASLAAANANADVCVASLGTMTESRDTCNADLDTMTVDLGLMTTSQSTCTTNLASMTASEGTCTADLDTMTVDLALMTTSLATAQATTAEARSCSCSRVGDVMTAACTATSQATCAPVSGAELPEIVGATLNYSNVQSYQTTATYACGDNEMSRTLQPDGTWSVVGELDCPPWILGALAESCSTVCTAEGLPCTDGDWGVVDQASLEAALAAAGQSSSDRASLCAGSYDAGLWVGNPIVWPLGSRCSWLATGATMSCSATNSLYRRLCRCA